MAKVNVKNFNSIKVRLKRRYVVISTVLLINFNSIKVRLKHKEELQVLINVLFQFHKGTIKTHMFCVIFSKPMSHFNSIKVRLKLETLNKVLYGGRISIP